MTNKRPLHLYNLFLALALLSSSPLLASSIVELNIPQLTKSSDKVVTGKVIDQQTRWDDSGKYLITYSTVQIEDVVRGEAKQKETVTVEQAGGTLDDTTQLVHGMVMLRMNQKLLLFLEKNVNSPVHKVTGFSQGIFQIRRNSSGQMMAVPPRGGDLKVLSKGLNGKLTRSNATQAPRPLDDLLEEIRNVR
jgi:hypothetical protein